MCARAALGSFADLLRWRAAEQPEAIAFSWLGQGSNHVDLSYGELDRCAQAIGALLQQEGPAGERALLLFGPGLEFVAALFGCFYAGWIAVPAYPPPLNQRLGRIQAVVRDAHALVALTSTGLLAYVKERVGAEHDLEQLRWRTVDGGSASLTAGMVGAPAVSVSDVVSYRASGAGHSAMSSDDWSPARLKPDDLAVLQYTSGSTAAPRGVMLTHGNLLHNTAQIEQRFGIVDEPASRGVIWLPPYHDMGLVGGILEGVFAGFPIDLMAPVAFLQRPRRWLEAITRSRATISGGPNFAYDLCVDRVPPAERAGLDLSSWRVAFNGSEPVREATLRRFTAAFGPCGFRPEAFYPCYGLAEATLMVAGGCSAAAPVVVTLDDDRTVVGCGRSMDDQALLIVDPSTGVACESGQVGEVWVVTGPSVAAGYWKQPGLTDEVFGARVSDRARTPPSPALRAASPRGRGGRANLSPRRTGGRVNLSPRGRGGRVNALPSTANGGGLNSLSLWERAGVRAGSEPASAEAPRYLRTGDLGFLRDGELFITGRLKAVLVLGGRKVQAEDIEATLMEGEGGARRPGGLVALAVDAGGEERLVIVQEVRSTRGAELEAVARSIRARVAEAHQLPVWAVALVRPGGVPRTSSGKVQRAACRDRFLNNQFQTVYEWRAPASNGRFGR